VTLTRIPADVERPDRIAFGLTARQLAILTLAGGAWWTLAAPAARLVGWPVAAGLAAPVALAGLGLALGWRDGLPLDRLALAALSWRRSPRRLVPAPGGVTRPPAWTRHAGVPLPAPLPGPPNGLSEQGVVDLGADGTALLCQASAVNLALRTEAEQQALVASFARVLHALASPVQILVRADRVDLGQAVAALEAAAPGLPHPGLEAACREHARFLAGLAGRREVLRRELLVVFREPAGTAHPAAVLAGRAEQAAALLAAAGVTLTVADGHQAAEILAHAAAPEAPARPAGGWALPDQVITGSQP
jgi:PrgI family protein